MRARTGSVRGRLLAAFVVASSIAGVAVVAEPRPDRSHAATVPPVPAIPGTLSTRTAVGPIGGEVTFLIQIPVLQNVRGDVVGLGDAWSCGSIGCEIWAIGWQLDVNWTVVRGCTATDLDCTVRNTPYEGGAWSTGSATLYRGNVAMEATGLAAYAPPVLSAVTVDGVTSSGAPAPATSGSPAYAVRPGTAPLPSECAPPDWAATQGYTASPVLTAPCVELFVVASPQQWWGTLPIGGTWIVYPDVRFNGPAGPITSAPGRRFSTVVLDVVERTERRTTVLGGVDQTTSTTTSTTSTTSTTTTTTTTTSPTATAPEPPVVTSAVSGSPGTVSGTVEGRPSSSVTVTVASSATPCARQMSGAGITAVGSTVVQLDPGGHAAFVVSGPVAPGRALYGTATSADGTSSVGECFVVASPPPTTSTTTTSPTTTSTTTTSPTTTSTTTTSPTTTSTTTTAPTSGATTTTASTVPGEARLAVASQVGFAIGDHVRIGEGAGAEVRVIAGFGSLVLATPMAKPHPQGSPVRVVRPPGGDRTPPTIRVESSEHLDRLRVGARVRLEVRCLDRGVGIESCAEDAPRLLDTAAAGEHELRLLAWDRNGNVSATTLRWRVVDPRGDDSCGPSVRWGRPWWVGPWCARR